MSSTSCSVGSQSRSPRPGGLIPSRPLRPSVSDPSLPLRDGPDVSWLSRCHVGDNQGADGACAIFAIANWAEIMHGRAITDADCLSLYRETLRQAGRPSGGLTFAEAFAGCRSAGWLPGARGLQRVGNLDALARQPIVAGYQITPAWERVSHDGCLDHSPAAAGPIGGYHAVTIVAHGIITGNTEPYVYIENSWGAGWGWQGIAVMTEPLHQQLCQELWIIV